MFSDLDKIYDAKLTKTLKKFTVKPITQVSNGYLKYTYYRCTHAPPFIINCICKLR